MSGERFQPGERVRVRAAHPPGHVRTPHYTRGHSGIIEAYAGAFPNPEELAYGRSGDPPVPLWRVRFEQRELWPDYAGPAQDTVVVDIYEHWLEPGGAKPRRGAHPANDEGAGAGRTRSRSRR
jgi:nitrile hydratase